MEIYRNQVVIRWENRGIQLEDKEIRWENTELTWESSGIKWDNRGIRWEHSRIGEIVGNFVAKKYRENIGERYIGNYDVLKPLISYISGI